MSETRGISVEDAREPVVVHYDIELDDAHLDPFAFRIYQRIARRCAGAVSGKCTESWGAMAAACQMSRAKLAASIRVLIQRKMISRQSKIGMVSHYALLDKKQWLKFERWQAKYRPAEVSKDSQHQSTTKTGAGNPSTTETTPRPPQRRVNPSTTKTGESTTETGPVHLVDSCKKTNKKTREEREEARARLAAHLDALEAEILDAYRFTSVGQNLDGRIKGQVGLLNAAGCESLTPFFTERRKLPSLSFLAEDWQTWRANDSQANGSTPPKPQYCGNCNHGWLPPGPSETRAKRCSCAKEAHT